MKKFSFHLLGLSHLPCNKKYQSCAFSQKNRKMAKMLTSLGHDVFFYGCEGSDVEEYCNSDKLHFVQTHTLKDLRDDYGEGNNFFEIGYDWTKQDFKHDLNLPNKNKSTKKFYQSCINHINEVKKDDDFILATQGKYHKKIIEETNLFLKCESGIGYRGSSKEFFRAFESSYIMNFTYGSENPYASMNGNYYDRVIPNYFIDDDFEFSDEKEDYFLFIGRMIKRKGIETAALTSAIAGKKLIIVGQGASIDSRGHLVQNNGNEFDIKPLTWEYQGFANVEKRKKLMSNAKAVFVPTIYLEPFGGTHIEAMLSGTPVITTNFGVFPGTIPDNLNGKIGFRCNTLQDFVDASRKVDKFNKKDYKFIRNNAERYLMDNVKYEYQKWFEDLFNLYESTKYKNKLGWHRYV